MARTNACSRVCFRIKNFGRHASSATRYGEQLWTRTESPVRSRNSRSGEEAVGKAIGDAKLQSDGKTDKAVGKIENAVGGLSDAVRDAAKKP